MKMTQKEAVFAAMTAVFDVSHFESRVEPTKEQRAQVNNILFEGFRAGSIELEKEYDDSKLKAYVSGLQSNWLRKDGRLNGGVAYVAKNPGSRAGSTDPQIKACRLLMATKTDPTERAEIQAFIDKRISEIKPTKSVELTPEHVATLEAAGLGHLVSE